MGGVKHFGPPHIEPCLKLYSPGQLNGERAQRFLTGAHDLFTQMYQMRSTASIRFSSSFLFAFFLAFFFVIRFVDLT